MIRSARFPLVILFVFASLVVPTWSQGQTQFFSMPGSFLAALNSTNQVFDVNSSGTIGIVLRNDTVNVQIPLLSTFNPVTGQVLDNRTFGFGPLHVELAEIPEGLRAVVLTSQGGPRNIFLFSISSAGLITSIAQTQLTTSINDGGSNIAVSPSAKAGFALVFPPTGSGKDLVSFSLVDGSILGRLHIDPALTFQDLISIVETSDGRRLLAFFNQLASIALVDATNASQPVLLGTVPLPFNQSKGLQPFGVAFSPDGRYVFASDGYADLSAIDVTARTVVGSIGGEFRYGTIDVSQGASGTQLAVYGADTTAALSLIDASNPASLAVIRRFTPVGLTQRTDIKFSKNGKTLYVLTNELVLGLDVPSLQESLVAHVPGPGLFQLPHQILVPSYCAPERVLTAMGVSSIIGSSNVARSFSGGPQKRDFDGDGKSDILWRDTAGNVSLWEMNGFTVALNTSIGNVWPGWKIEGSGDFNADGKSDILWRDAAGNVVVWLMDGPTLCSYGMAGNMPLSAAVAGVADFDGDGRADVLWRTISGDVVLWRMNGAGIPTNTVIDTVWTGWAISGAADFNGDGKADILWRSVSGEVAIWLMNGTTVLNATAIGNVWTGWSIADTGDFNGDGKADILWRSTSGEVAIWLMDGTTLLSGTLVASIPTDWAITGVRDFDGNSREDILWRDSSGNIAVWLMNGTTLSSYAGLGNVSDRTSQ